MKRDRRGEAAVLGAILLVAFSLRWACVHTEPWLDEIWSIGLARSVRSWWGVFWDLHHDNNNPLNTLWLYFVRDCRDFAAFRGLSMLCGLLTVAVLADDPAAPGDGLRVAAMAAVSAPLVLYSTEARGYAPMLLCSVACRRLLDAPAPLAARRAWAFAACATLGMYSQPSFVYALGALFLWAAIKTPAERRVPELARLFGPVVVLFGAYSVHQIGRMSIGGGPGGNAVEAAVRALALAAGAPLDGPGRWLGAAVLGALATGELLRLHRAGDDEFWYHASLFAGAAGFVGALPFKYDRYFLACLPSALLLAARAAGRLARGGRAVNAAIFALAGLFVYGNAARVGELATKGRGHYLEAVRRMADATPSGPILVAGDHDFRNKTVLDFYAPYTGVEGRLKYVDSSVPDAGGAPWYLRHALETDPRVFPVSFEFAAGGAYDLLEIYPHAGLSGWTWALYRRRPASGT